MKIKALKTLVGDYGRLEIGEFADLPSHIANPLIARGYVADVENLPPAEEPKPKPRRMVVRNAAPDA